MTPSLHLQIGSQSIHVPIEGSMVSTFLMDHTQAPDEIARALRIGVEVLSSSGAVLDTQIVEKSFDRLKTGFEERLQSALASLDPKSEETPASQIIDAFRTEANTLLSAMNPANAESPMGKLATEIRRAIQSIAVNPGKQEIRESTPVAARSFVEVVSSTLADATAPLLDTVASMGDAPGTSVGNAGGFLISCSPEHSVRIVVESKQTRVALNRRFIEDELRPAMSDCGASACILVVHSANAECVGGPIRFLEDGIVACVVDPDSADDTALVVAYHYARQVALSLRDADRGSFDRCRVMEQVSALMAKVEEISTSERSLSMMTGELDKTRANLHTNRKAILTDLRQLLEAAKGDPQPTPRKLPVEIPDIALSALTYDEEIVEIAPVIPVEPVACAEKTLDSFAALVSYSTPAKTTASEASGSDSSPIVRFQQEKPIPKAKAPTPKVNVVVAPSPMSREQRREETEPLLF